MSVFPPQAHFHLMAKPSSFHCNIQCEYCFYLEKIRTVWATCAFYVERHLKTLCQKLYQSHAGNVVEFGNGESRLS